jgi:hypothetical protein
MSKVEWILTADSKPEPYVTVIGTNGKGYVLVVWHPDMGYGPGGDFAIITNKKRSTVFSHCPGVIKWIPVPELK